MSVRADSASKHPIRGTVRFASRLWLAIDTADARDTQRLFFATPVLVEEYRIVFIPTRAVSELRLSRGRSRLRAAVHAALEVGLTIAPMTGAAGVVGKPSITFACVGRGALRGAAAGALVGAIAGGIWGKHERWGEAESIDWAAPASRSRSQTGQGSSAH